MSIPCVLDDPFGPENLAGQVEYLIDNQSIYLVRSIVTLSPTQLAMELETGERYIVTFERTN